jgi:putative FmdB family regulatory protein
VPTYAYACTTCGHRFEVQQSFTDASLTECPECDGRLRKLFNSVGIVFKGSGFYRTDSRNGSSSASEKGAGKESGAKESAAKEPGSGSVPTKETSSTPAEAAKPASSAA